MLHSWCIRQYGRMTPQHRPLLAQAISCWNWKCALLSATARSLVYLAAMARTGPHGRIGVIVVELAYVTLTSGIYAGIQQKALALRSRFWGNLIIVVGVPGVAQILDWVAHRISGAAVTGKATLAVSVFATLSALFHLHVMRNGTFLTGTGRSLYNDFRRIPRLVAGFVVKPVVVLLALTSSSARAAEPDAAL